MFIWNTILAGPYLTYLGAALLPAVVLLIYIYRKDRIDKEPAYLLRKMLAGGVFAAFAAMALEYGFQNLQYYLFELKDFGYTAFQVMTAFLVGLSEEGAKLYFVRRGTWNDANLNYTFDAIVYCVFASLGFAAFENVLYVFQGGLTVALTRAVLTVPAHMCFAVFMGIYYGRAKVCDARGDSSGVRLNHALAFAVPVLFSRFRLRFTRARSNSSS
jgi:RsiW-degrading membrane proteinase PrsW (M82 family)